MKNLSSFALLNLLLNTVIWGILTLGTRPWPPNAYGVYNDMGDFWVTLNPETVTSWFKPLNFALTIFDQDEQGPWLSVAIILFVGLFYYLSKNPKSKVTVTAIILTTLWWTAFFIYIWAVTPGGFLKLIVDCPH